MKGIAWLDRLGLWWVGDGFSDRRHREVSQKLVLLGGEGKSVAVTQLCQAFRR